MERLLLFFAVASIGIALRFFVLGELEWKQLLFASCFFAGALLIWGIERWLAWLDARYEEAGDEDVWHTHMAERFWTGKKRLFKGGKKMGEFWRFFPFPWQRIANGILSDQDQWYLNLSFVFADGTSVQIIEQRKKLFCVNDVWHIVQNGMVAAVARTDYSWKNKLKLRERMIVEIQGKTLFFQSPEMVSRTEVWLDGKVIAEGKRSRRLRWSYTFHVNKGYEEWERALVAAYVLFNYAHHQ
ncbi:tubby C-terminal domain-like protein [Parageobacillus thermoglucosidasius]|uniref:Tubby C-terminal domain-containing protein n=1 Tax=Parageobacillus thermoglucosidasius TaxID=1426 RepID=A0A1B7KME4_PARTM|nr:hypothetical protein [Parageobacillus thermoglucosidasius]OAT71255.1 hypothetical protein A7K69_15855 [Parageobacillus thermoglucosidasius]